MNTLSLTTPWVLLFLLFSGVVFADRAQESAQSLRVEDAYVRAVAPGQINSAAFMRLINPGDQIRTLVSASSRIAEVVELHTHSLNDGVMEMRRIDRIEVPAHGQVNLEPGGLHVMLIGLKHPLRVQEPVDLRLIFDNGAEVTTTAITRALVP